jgi:glycosyltransferase involved in cell wall biosynthesis
MASLGHHVEVVQRGDWSPPWPFYRLQSALRASHQERAAFLDDIDGIAVHHPLTVRPRPSRFFMGDSWQREAQSIARYAVRRLRARPFDAVLAHFLVPDGYHGLALGAALGVPVAAMAWGDDVHAWPARNADWAQRLQHVLRSADALIACSERMAGDASHWMAERRQDWHVVYGGVDLDRYRPTADRAAARARVLSPGLTRQLPDMARIILVLAQPATAKGYIELLDVWSRLAPSHTDWWLVMAGGPGGDLQIHDEIAKRGPLPRAVWLGAQPPDRIPDLLAASDAFVLPSHNEGLSLSVLEAMASGLPTITTDVGGHAEVIRSSADGWLIAPTDAGALANAMVELMADEAQRRRRGSNARQAAVRIGSPLDNARRLVAILEQMVATRHEARGVTDSCTGDCATPLHSLSNT